MSTSLLQELYASAGSTAAIPLKKDKHGHVTNLNHRNEMARLSMVHGNNDAKKKEQADADFAATWALGSPANNAESPANSFHNAAQVFIVLSSAYTAAANDEEFHRNITKLRPEDVINEHGTHIFMNEHLDAA